MRGQVSSAGRVYGEDPTALFPRNFEPGIDFLVPVDPLNSGPWPVVHARSPTGTRAGSSPAPRIRLQAGGTSDIDHRAM